MCTEPLLIRNSKFGNRRLYLCHGYLREAQNMIDWEHDPQIIPQLAMHLIINYYWIPEYFDKISKCINVSTEQRALTMKPKVVRWNNSNFGKFEIKTCPESIHKTPIVCKWEFRIAKTKTSHFIIGIASHSNTDTSFLWNAISYGFCGYEQPKTLSMVNHENESRLIENNNYGTVLKQNDIVEMVFDTKHKTLSFSINDRDQGIGVENIEYGCNIIYRMAVTIGDPGDEIELINFEATYVH